MGDPGARGTRGGRGRPGLRSTPGSGRGGRAPGLRGAPAGSPGLGWRPRTRSRRTSCCRTCAAGSWAGVKVAGLAGRLGGVPGAGGVGAGGPAGAAAPWAGEGGRSPGRLSHRCPARCRGATRRTVSRRASASSGRRARRALPCLSGWRVRRAGPGHTPVTARGRRRGGGPGGGATQFPLNVSKGADLRIMQRCL